VERDFPGPLTFEGPDGFIPWVWSVVGVLVGSAEDIFSGTEEDFCVWEGAVSVVPCFPFCFEVEEQVEGLIRSDGCAPVSETGWVVKDSLKGALDIVVKVEGAVVFRVEFGWEDADLLVCQVSSKIVFRQSGDGFRVF